MNDKFFDDLDGLRDENLNLEIEILELQKELFECRKSLRLLQSFKVANLEAKKSDSKIKEKLKKEILALREIISEIPTKYTVDDENIFDKVKKIVGMI